MRARIAALAVSAVLLASCASEENADVADKAIELQSILGDVIEMGAIVAADPSIPLDDPVVAYAGGLGDALGPHVDDLGTTFARLAESGTDGFAHEDEAAHSSGGGALDQLLAAPADQLLVQFRRLVPAMLDDCSTTAAELAEAATDEGLRDLAARARQTCQAEAGRLASLG